jgi:hypothetical protein
MRKTFVAVAAALVFGAAGTLVASQAQATPFGASSGLRVAAEELGLVDEVRHRCYRTRYGWVCPRHGHRHFHRHRHHRHHHHRHRRHRY